MPPQLAFLFTKITPEQMIYMWNVLTTIFIVQCLMILSYCFALASFPDHFWTCTLCFAVPFAYICIQQIYIDHDVMHGVTFPPYEFQKFLTHPFSDFLSLPWEEFVLEHARHHASTVDLLMQGEFGWDPEEFHYTLQQWAGPMGPNWYKYLLTVPWIPVIHFFGLNDTGSLFALEWWMSFPEADASGKCNKEFWSKWFPRRVKHNAFVWFMWTLVWLLGTYPLGRPLSEGWRFVLPVTCAARTGFSLAWMFITNFTHSLPWNKFLENDPGRTWPVLHNVMALAVGGKHRWNEMLFHDVHHAFPNALGTGPLVDLRLHVTCLALGVQYADMPMNQHGRSFCGCYYAVRECDNPCRSHNHHWRRLRHCSLPPCASPLQWLQPLHGITANTGNATAAATATCHYRRHHHQFYTFSIPKDAIRLLI
ncbi:unnamed protein product [Symbiodinium pilosum]|uniref:Fatty acid desaturase domain-containing protein n=1 Tax=Symbiodinium pilosum TaxID=2952 RepID=A0A812X2W3_SYMPI|nr:unnamed protein product [Symbiodinium pilosum]